VNDRSRQSSHTDHSPLVTVIIITYNGRRFLKECLDSVLDQDFPREHYEIIVADNASQDGSADFIEQNYPGVRLLRLDRNYGPGQAINRALTHMRGKYLAYLNQDIVAHRRWLAELVEVITTHPQAGIVESNMILPQWPEFEGKQRERKIERAFVCDITSLGTHDFRVVPVTPTTVPIPVLSAYCAACIANLQIIEQLGYWLDPALFAYADDVDIGLRLNAAGYQVLLAPRSVVYHETDWHLKWDMRTMRRVFWATRNMFLVFYKVGYMSEFLILLPRLMLGKMLKAGQHTRSRLRKLAYAIAALPMLLIALMAALIMMPSFHERRQLTLSRRKMEKGWLTQCLAKANWQPDPTIWALQNASSNTDHQSISTTPS
jgi:GT2 family glycosyltransferase